MTVSVVRQTVVEESLDIDLSPEQQAQFDKLTSLEDKAAYLDSLLADDQAAVSVASRSEMSAVTQVQDENNVMAPAAPEHYTEYLSQKRKESMPLKEHSVRYVGINEDGSMGVKSQKIEAPTYMEAIVELFKNAVQNGEMIDRVMPAPSGEVVPALVQLDDRVFDLTPMADEQGATLMVGAIAMNLKRMGNDISLSVEHQHSGEELDCLTISDEDYLKGLEPESGPRLS
ncbi:hypothetical protein [Marinobacter sp. MBR-105]|jgi:hypothetical protein